MKLSKQAKKRLMPIKKFAKALVQIEKKFGIDSRNFYNDGVHKKAIIAE